MTPNQIRTMPTQALVSSVALYNELQSRSTVDELILAFMENELQMRLEHRPCLDSLSKDNIMEIQ